MHSLTTQQGQPIFTIQENIEAISALMFSCIVNDWLSLLVLLHNLQDFWYDFHFWLLLGNQSGV